MIGYNHCIIKLMWLYWLTECFVYLLTQKILRNIDIPQNWLADSQVFTILSLMFYSPCNHIPIKQHAYKASVLIVYLQNICTRIVLTKHLYSYCTYKGSVLVLYIQRICTRIVHTKDLYSYCTYKTSVLVLYKIVIQRICTRIVLIKHLYLYCTYKGSVLVVYIQSICTCIVHT